LALSLRECLGDAATSNDARASFRASARASVRAVRGSAPAGLRSRVRPGVRSHIFQRLTSTLPRQRNINCPLCNHPENFLHINFDCDFIQHAARSFVTKCSQFTPTLKLNAKNWFSLRVLHRIPWLQATFQWSLWKFRNQALHNSDYHYKFEILLMQELKRQLLFLQSKVLTFESRRQHQYYENILNKIDECVFSDFDFTVAARARATSQATDIASTLSPSAHISRLATETDSSGAISQDTLGGRVPAHTGQLPAVLRR